MWRVFFTKKLVNLRYATLSFQAMGETLNAGQEIPISKAGNGEDATKSK
jgi:hypothetical protein